MHSDVADQSPQAACVDDINLEEIIRQSIIGRKSEAIHGPVNSCYPKIRKTSTIYLAGGISGLTYEESVAWRNEVIRVLPPWISALSPMRGKETLKSEGVLSGAYSGVMTTSRGITTRDRNDVMTSDLVIMNLLGAKSISIGTMIEAGWCDILRKPLIVVMEKAGNPHEHPMLTEILGFRTDNLNEAVKTAVTVLTGQ